MELEEKLILEESKNILYESLDSLSTIEKVVLCCKYGLLDYDQMQLDEIRDYLYENYNIFYRSLSYLNHIEKKAYKKLKKHLKRCGFTVDILIPNL